MLGWAVALPFILYPLQRAPEAPFQQSRHYRVWALVKNTGSREARRATVAEERWRTAGATGSRPRWAAELGMRVRRSFVLTLIGTTVFIGLFFIGYFYVQRHPAYTPIMMPVTPLDLMIPFQPNALLAYVSLWIYVGAGPGLQRTFTELAVYSLWMAGLCITGLAIFYFWPTQTPPLTDPSTFSAFAVLHRLDKAGNACPSMHVAVAIFTLGRVDEVLRSTRSPLWLRLVNVAWFAVIAYSTLAVKQHVALDDAAGALLGVAFLVPSLRWRPKPRRETNLADVTRLP
jgi:membrane-associated phospholipid phosphatase